MHRGAGRIVVAATVWLGTAAANAQGPAPQPAPPPVRPRSDPGQGFRIALALPTVGALGSAKHTDLTSYMGTVRLDGTWGLGALFERCFSYFAVGGGVRVLFWQFAVLSGDRIRATDIYFSPRLRIPFRFGEVFLTTPIGASIDVAPADQPFVDRAGYGFNVALQAGVQFYAGSVVAFYADAGGLWRHLYFAADRYYAPHTFQVVTPYVLVDLGVAFLL